MFKKILKKDIKITSNIIRFTPIGRDFSQSDAIMEVLSLYFGIPKKKAVSLDYNLIEERRGTLFYIFKYKRRYYKEIEDYDSSQYTDFLFFRKTNKLQKKTFEEIYTLWKLSGNLFNGKA